MEIIRDLTNIKLNNTAVAVGKFDGLHSGHMLIMKELHRLKEKNFTTVVFTFLNAPTAGVNDNKQQYILTIEEKHLFYKNLGIDILIECDMNKNFVTMDREFFLKEILINKLGMKKIICGSDFGFGYKRKGNIDYLYSMEQIFGYQTVVFEKLTDNLDEISSTLIRKNISEGQINRVNHLLGYSYTIIGKVVHGNEIGRTINYPTANIIPERNKLLPPNGVYFTKVEIDGNEYKAITNIGTKPTVCDNRQVVVETNVMNFSDDLYDKIITIRFYHYHRNEKKFTSLQELKHQISIDSIECERYFM